MVLTGGCYFQYPCPPMVVDVGNNRNNIKAWISPHWNVSTTMWQKNYSGSQNVWAASKMLNVCISSPGHTKCVKIISVLRLIVLNYANYITYFERMTNVWIYLTPYLKSNYNTWFYVKCNAFVIRQILNNLKVVICKWLNQLGILNISLNQYDHRYAWSTWYLTGRIPGAGIWGG